MALDDLLNDSEDTSFEALFPSADPPAEDRNEVDPREAEIAALRADLEAVKSRPVHVTVAPNSTPYVSGPPLKTTEEQALELEQNFMAAPGRTLQRVREETTNQVKTEAFKMFVPVAAATARNQAFMFLNTMQGDETYSPEAAKEFQKMVNESTDDYLASVPSQSFPALFENAWDLAFAKAQKAKLKSGGRAGNPPPYNAGTGGKATGTVGGSRKLTPSQVEFVKNARAAELDEKEIREMIDSGEVV